MILGTILLYAFVFYLGAGFVTAILFSVYGASKLAHGAPVSCGARVLLIPAAVAFWPLILKRWLGAAK
jgi:hypothetical protein